MEDENIKKDGRGFANMDPEQHKKISSKGGINSGKKRAERAEFREVFNSILKMPLKNGDVASIEDIQSLGDVKNLNLSTNVAMAMAVLQKALAGDLEAFKIIRDTVGEKPVDKVESVNEVVVIKDDI